MVANNRVCPRCGGPKGPRSAICRNCEQVRRRARRFAERVMAGERFVLDFRSVEADSEEAEAA